MNVATRPIKDLKRVKEMVLQENVKLSEILTATHFAIDAEARAWVESQTAPAVAGAEATVVVAPTFFESIALPLAERFGVPVAPCYPWYHTDAKGNDGKTVNGSLVSSPLTMRSTEPKQIRTWGRAEKDGNVCLYAVQEDGGLCFVDKDGATSLRAKYEKETGKPFPKTLLVRSSTVPDGSGGTIVKGHWYFSQTPRTMQAKNIAEAKTGGLFSFRVNNMYIAAIGSIHPKTQKPYEVAEDYPVLPMPDDFLDWLQAQVVSEPKTREEVEQRGKYGLGTRYTALMSELGRLWNRGYDRAGLVAAGLAWARTNFDTGAEEFNEALVQKEIEHYADTYGDGQDKSIALTQQPPQTETRPAAQAVLDATAAAHSADELLDVVKKATFRPFESRRSGVDYHYESALVHGQLIVWAAPTKGKKSSFALLKAMCDASGADWYNFRNMKGPMAVFYLDTENSDSDLHERYHEYLTEFSSAQQELIEKNLHIVFGKEIAKSSGVELELHNTALWNVLERYIPDASVIYLDCWYDLHDAKDSDAKTQKAALQIALQRFKGKTVHIVQHIGREMMENLTKKNGAALRFIGGPAYINRIAQSFVLARKAEAFILQETFDIKDEDGNVEEEVVDFQIWGRSIPKLPMLTFHQVSFDGEKEYSFRHEIDTKLSKGAASLLFKMKNKGPWDSLRDLLKDVGAGYGGKQKVVLDELRFKGYVKYDIDGIHLRPMSHDVLMSAAKSPAAKKDADQFLERVLMPNGVPNSGVEDDFLRELAKTEGILLMGPLAYKNVQPVTIDGKTIWRMVHGAGRYSQAETESLRAEVAKLIKAEPSISKKELTRRLSCDKETIENAVNALGYQRLGRNGAWRKVQNTSTS